MQLKSCNQSKSNVLHSKTQNRDQNKKRKEWSQNLVIRGFWST